MGNPLKGDVALVVGARSYTLCFSVDALCQLEEKLGQGFPAIAMSLLNPATLRIGTARAVLWAGLREHHPEVDLKAAGELMLEAGGTMKVMETIDRALTLAFPGTDPESSANPPKPGQDGTGSASGGSGAASG